MSRIIPIDLKFLNHKGTIAVYLIPYSGGAVLVESGPGSTIETVKEGLAAHNLAPKNVTHVLLTHIHLDHAGAAGWLSRQGAQVFVHPAGIAHLLDPKKLLESARRLYGEPMDSLWGEFLPVSKANLTEINDGEEIAVGELHFKALHTPGHAKHHICYLLDDICFSGDEGGIRMPGPLYLRLPFVPPETNLNDWRSSLVKLQKAGSRRIAPTHFGIYNDASSHLSLALRVLDETERWLEAEMLSDPSIEILRKHFMELVLEQGRIQGVSDYVLEGYYLANPTWMSADGLARYWEKFRNPQETA